MHNNYAMALTNEMEAVIERLRKEIQQLKAERDELQRNTPSQKQEYDF